MKSLCKVRKRRGGKGSGKEIGLTILDRIRQRESALRDDEELYLLELFALQTCAFRDPYFGVRKALALTYMLVSYP